MTVVLAAGFVAAAVWVLSLPPPAALRLVALRPGRSATRPAYGAGAGPAEWIRHVVGGGHRTAAAHRMAVVELCDGLAVEFAAGRPPEAALVNAASVLSGLAPIRAVTAAATTGGDVAAGLDRVATVPGCEGLRLLAGCWRIAIDRGAMPTAVIEGLAEALRDEREHRAEVALQLAGPRATARLLAALPLLGVAMGVALGARPLAFLFGTVPGAGCLCLGVGLDLLGLWWIHRLVTRAEESR